MPSDEIAALFPGKQRQIYEMVRDAGALGIATESMMAKLYENDPNGGPTGNVISSLLASVINPRLKQFGLRISARTGPGAIYRLFRTGEVSHET